MGRGDSVDSVIIDLEYALAQAKRGDRERCIDGLNRAVDALGRMNKACAEYCEHCPEYGHCGVCGVTHTVLAMSGR